VITSCEVREDPTQQQGLLHGGVVEKNSRLSVMKPIARSFVASAGILNNMGQEPSGGCRSCLRKEETVWHLIFSYERNYSAVRMKVRPATWDDYSLSMLQAINHDRS